MTVEIKGLAELKRDFAVLPAKMQRAVVRNTLRAAAKPVVDEAKRLAPEASGDLKAGIKMALRVNKNVGEARIGFEKDEYYGKFHELGTSKMPARPFLRPALFNSEGEVVRLFAAALGHQIARFTAKAGGPSQ